jgi:hypothetical protein
VETSDKLSKLDCLRVDTGDFELDKQLSGYMKVTVGYKYFKLMSVRCRPGLHATNVPNSMSAIQILRISDGCIPYGNPGLSQPWSIIQALWGLL